MILLGDGRKTTLVTESRNSRHVQDIPIFVLLDGDASPYTPYQARTPSIADCVVSLLN